MKQLRNRLVLAVLISSTLASSTHAQQPELPGPRVVDLKSADGTLLKATYFSAGKHCEIDSGRFPVELTANRPSPLRMSPGAGLDFGTWAVGQPSNPLTITLFNDPKDPNSQTVNFTGNLVKGDFAETDDCGTSLAPGDSCTLTITFTPKVVGFDQGTITIAYTLAQTQIVHLRGIGQ